MATFRKCVCSIMPPHILLKLMEHHDKDVRDSALHSLLTTASLRGGRSIRTTMGIASVGSGVSSRTIYDLQDSSTLNTGTLSRSETDDPATDDSVNNAFDGFGKTRDFYKQIFERDGIDGNGMPLNGYVHYGVKYNNAFWDGAEMIFGDGDGVRFIDFTDSVDVIAHELTHGVTQHTAGLSYHFQSGALNESISDVFGSLVKQWAAEETADKADWLIGAGIMAPGSGATALRSLKAPGTAYNTHDLGKDPQPDHMSKFVKLPDTPQGDNGGVHINSGIPNKVFYLVATAIGGNAWEAPGHIWYESLKASTQTTQFQDFADTTFFKAGQLYGASSAEQQAVQDAWKEVGIQVSATPLAASRIRAGSSSGQKGDSLAALTKKIESLADAVKSLAKDVKGLKGKK